MSVALISFILGYKFSFSFSTSNNIIGFFVGITIYALAYSTWNKKNIQNIKSYGGNLSDNFHLKNFSAENNRTRGRNIFVLSDKQLEEFSIRLEKAISEEKVFTENEFSLTGVK